MIRCSSFFIRGRLLRSISTVAVSSFDVPAAPAVAPPAAASRAAARRFEALPR
jgi:hypothetical protein